MFPFKIKDVLFSKEVEMAAYDSVSDEDLIDTGLYGICRHPMQASLVILLIFGSNVFTYDHLIFSAVHLAGIIVGVIMEERRLLRRLTKYKEYKKKVKYWFFPYILWSITK